MILEAFSRYLQNAAPELPASQVLSLWLWERLASTPKNAVDQVIHCEVEIARAATNQPASHPRTIRLPADAELALKLKGRLKGQIGSAAELESSLQNSKAAPKDSPAYFFKGASSSGSRLLNSLYEYSMSYEQQKWSRFIHSVKASDFHLLK
ncbi:MAG: hypothetical protein KGS72_03485 [Cyanobacteria bacterium REEB67]|nr:hypothetical protein [Cyanobacteria bacterium REEB67]